MEIINDKEAGSLCSIGLKLIHTVFLLVFSW